MSRNRKALPVVLWGIVLLGLGGCPPWVGHEIIFDQSNFAQDGYVSILDGVDYAPSPQAAERFVLHANLPQIAVIQWWGTQDPALTDPDDFIIRIFEDNGSGLPKAVPLYAIPVGAVDRANTGETAKPEMGSPPIYAYARELIPFDLVSGAPYYISIVNTTGHDWVWMWTDDVDASTQAYSRMADGDPWTASLTHDLALRLWQ